MVEAGFNPTWFSKPGDTLTVLMRRQNLSPPEVAALIDRDVKTVQGLIAGFVSIDDGLAEAIAAHIGGSPTFWRKRQNVYDSALEKAVEGFSEKARAEWLKILPLPEIAQFAGAERRSSPAMLRASLAYFAVSDAAEWQTRYAEALDEVAFHTSKAFTAHVGATAAWLRQGELEASMVPCKPWNPGNLRDRLDDIRKLARAKAPAYFVPRLRQLCADTGVAVVVVRAPNGCRASGATRFIAPDKAMINLSLRHKSDDHFWFTLFHEIAHLLLHEQNATFVDGDTVSTDAREAEANKFAAEVLIPTERQDELKSLRARRDPVLRFAASLGIPPGIVVGQAQHRKIFAHRQLQYLKRRFDLADFEAALA